MTTKNLLKFRWSYAMNKYTISRKQYFNDQIVKIYHRFGYIAGDLGYKYIIIRIKNFSECDFEYLFANELTDEIKNNADAIWKLPDHGDLLGWEYRDLIKIWLIIKLRYFFNNYKAFSKQTCSHISETNS